MSSAYVNSPALCKHRCKLQHNYYKDNENAVLHFDFCVCRAEKREMCFNNCNYYLTVSYMWLEFKKKLIDKVIDMCEVVWLNE